MKRQRYRLLVLMICTFLFLALVLARGQFDMPTAEAQPNPLMVWFAGTPDEFARADPALEYLSKFSSQYSGSFDIKPVGLDTLLDDLEFAAVNGVLPDAVVTNHLNGTLIYFTGWDLGFCMPGQCPQCQGVDQPPWCPYVQGQASPRTGGLALDLTQEWMAFEESGGQAVPYGVPLWWDYFEPQKYALDPQLPVVVYSAYAFPASPNHTAMLDVLQELFRTEEAQLGVAEAASGMPIHEATVLPIIDEIFLTQQIIGGHLVLPFLPLPTHCVDFEDLPIGMNFKVGDIINTGHMDFEARDYQWPNNKWTSDGFSEVSDGLMAGGFGQEMTVNNINLFLAVHDQFMAITGQDVITTALSLRFGEYGGNLNLEINGDFINFGDISQLNGSQLGGTLITTIIPPLPVGGEIGFVLFQGEIKTFMIGGQELFVDELCFQTHTR